GFCGVKVSNDQGWRYLRVADQTFLTDRTFDQFTLFSDGVACVAQGKKWGHLGIDGELIGKVQYDRTFWFKGPVAQVQSKTGWNLVTRDGKKLRRKNFQRVWDPREGVAIFTDDGSTYCFIDANGTVLRDGLSMAHGFENGLAAAAQDGKFGFIDPSGDWVIEPQFGNAQAFSDGL